MVTYGDEERAAALAILEAHGRHMTRAALHEIGQALGRTPSRSVVHGWLKQLDPPQDKPNPEPIHSPEPRTRKRIIPAPLIVDAKRDLSEALESLVWTYVERAAKDEVVNRMGGKDLALAIGILIDKMRLLRGLPTEIIALMPDLLAAIERRNLKASDVFEAMLNELQQQDV